MHLRKSLSACALSLLVFAGLAGSAGAVHWPYFGGDAGRSGYQPVDEGGAPVGFVYAKAEGPVVTSVVTSAGTPTTQRLIYGTQAGLVHQQILLSGAAAGAEAGVDISNGADTDTLTGNGGSVSPLETSGAALGQIYVVHNDDNQGGTDDLAIAQIDEATGALVKDVPLQGTDGYTISSSPVATPANAGGGRSIFFVASATGATRLFKVAISNADAQATTIGTPESVVVTGANPLASPTLVYLANASAQATEYVAVAAGSQIRTYATADLAVGPQSANLGGTPQTPSVPVTSGGTTPGQGTNPAPSTAPSMFVAVSTSGTTLVYKLAQQANALATVATSAPLPGAPAPALAVTQEVPATGAPTGGKVVVTTAANLYLLSADNLGASGTLSATALTAAAGFSRTTAAASGELVYVTRDNGEQLVLRLADAQPVAAADFTQNAANTGSAAAYGQPSISRGFVQFASDKGVFVYRNKDLVAPTVTVAVSGNTVTATAFDFRGIDSVAFQVDGKAVATDTTGEGNSFATPGATFTATVDASKLARGPHKVTAVAKDASGLTATAEATITGAGAAGGTTPPAGGKPGACTNPQTGSARNDLLSGTSFGDLIHGGLGNDVISGFSGLDCLHGDAGNDRLFGGNDVDRLFGGVGADFLDGAAGNDFLSGGTGNDRISGGAGNDQLYGGVGNDNLTGGVGVDRLDGNAGNDVINAYDRRREIVNCGTGVDRVVADRLDVLRQCERVTRKK
jgi:Ca2+-binding RTX toxin-like protein